LNQQQQTPRTATVFPALVERQNTVANDEDESEYSVPVPSTLPGVTKITKRKKKKQSKITRENVAPAIESSEINIYN